MSEDRSSRLTELRVGSLNLRAYPNPSRDQIQQLAAIVAAQRCDIVLLQECMRPWLRIVCEAGGLVGVHAHRLAPASPERSFSPDGCAIAVRPPIELGRCWRIQPEQFMPDSVHAGIPDMMPHGFEPLPPRLAYRSSGRAILAELRVGGAPIVVGSFHAAPGSGKVRGRKVGEWKPFFHGAVALEFASIDAPFVFAIDANEPLTETAESITFHWAEGRPGAEKMKALLGLEPIHRGRDLFREWLACSGMPPATEELLAVTYAPSEAFQRRFDSIWATQEFAVTHFATHFKEVRSAGGDHALLVADLLLDASRSAVQALGTRR